MILPLVLVFFMILPLFTYCHVQCITPYFSKKWRKGHSCSHKSKLHEYRTTNRTYSAQREKRISNTNNLSATKIPSRWPVAAPNVRPYCSTVHILPSSELQYNPYTTSRCIVPSKEIRVAQSRQSPDQTFRVTVPALQFVLRNA
jgi:hypothetical protein